MRSRERNKMINLAVISKIAMQVTGSKYANNKNFENDSGTPIRVDNRFSGFIFNVMDDFIGPLVECNNSIKGFGGTRKGEVKIVTIKWKWLGKYWKRHKFLIPKSYYVTQGVSQLLSPRHWSQAQRYENTIQGT